MIRRALRAVADRLPASTRRRLKSNYYRTRKILAERRHGYGPIELEAAFRDAGVCAGDAVMLHAAVEPFSGFRGEARDVVDCLLKTLGPQGHLAMVSMPYTGLSLDYLTKGKPFRVSRSVSRMGWISEIFRRRHGVVRSLNPVHPVLVSGPGATRIVERHEETIYPAGPASPFGRLEELDASILFFDARFGTCTFLHYLEHRFRERLGGELYCENLFEATIFDAEDRPVVFKTHVYEPRTNRARDAFWVRVEAELLAQGRLEICRIGNSQLMHIKVRTIVDSVAELLNRGEEERGKMA